MHMCIAQLHGTLSRGLEGRATAIRLLDTLSDADRLLS